MTTLPAPIDGKAIRVYFDTEGNVLPGDAIKLYPSNIKEYLGSGGNTFIEDAPADSRLYGRKNNTWTNFITFDDYVITVNEDGTADYETLDEAFSAVQSPTDVIFLLSDTTLSAAIGTIPECIVTGLPDKKITIGASTTWTKSSGTGLTVFDNLHIYSLSESKSESNIYCNSGHMEFNNCRFTSSLTGIFLYIYGSSGGDLTFKNCTLDYSAQVSISNGNIFIYNMAVLNGGYVYVTSSQITAHTLLIDGLITSVGGNGVVSSYRNAQTVLISNSLLYTTIDVACAINTTALCRLENSQFISGTANAALFVNNTADLTKISASNCLFQNIAGGTAIESGQVWNPANLYYCRTQGTLTNVTIPAANYPITL